MKELNNTTIWHSHWDWKVKRPQHTEISLYIHLHFAPSVLTAMGVNADFMERDAKSESVNHVTEPTPSYYFWCIFLDLATVLKKVKPQKIWEETSLLLRRNLGLKSGAGLEQHVDLHRIVQEWYDAGFVDCTLEDLLKVLMCTPSLGRFVSGLVPLCKLLIVVVFLCGSQRFYLETYWQLWLEMKCVCVCGGGGGGGAGVYACTYSDFLC